MNIIKGLMVKDLLQLKSYKRTLIMFVIIFICTSFVQEHTRNVLVIMMTLGLGMFSIATFSYDEMAKADRYILTLPLTKKEVVLSKYVLVIILTIIGAILGVIISIIIALIINQKMPDLRELIMLGLGSLLGIGLVEGIQIPCIYKYGVEKGRIQIFIILAVVAFLIGGIVFIGEKLSISLVTNHIVEIFTKFLPIILVLAIVVIYFVSYKISYKIYCKKEI